jgi:hypothetical protein
MLKPYKFNALNCDFDETVDLGGNPVRLIYHLLKHYLNGSVLGGK